MNYTENTDRLRPEGFSISIYSLALSTLAINILSLALPVMTLQVYDRILPNPYSGTLPVLMFGVGIAIILEVFLRLARSYAMAWSGAAYDHRLSCAAIDHLLHVDSSRTKPCGIGEQLQRLLSIGKLKDFYNGQALIIILDLAFIVLFLGLITYIAGFLVLVPLTILASFIGTSLYFGKRLKAALHEREACDDERYNFLIESLEGIHALKSFSLEASFQRRYERMEEESGLANFDVTEATAKAFNIATIFSHVMIAAVISAGAFMVLQGHITNGALIASVLISGRIMQPVQRGLSLWTRYQDYTLARKKVHELFSMPTLQNRPLEHEHEKDGTIELRNVSFGFSGEDRLLGNISLFLQRGDIITISGAHGSGKTALLNLIAGFYPASEGTVFVDGMPVMDIPPERLIHHVGYITTQGTIFRGTIRDNITRFGAVDETQAKEITALLKLDHDVAKLPSGFDTRLDGSTTDSIAPGLKQRIAMARVLATKPRIILFDNADRALDRDGYNLTFDLLGRLKGKATMILISDDYNIRGLAEKHYALTEGQLVAVKEDHNMGHIKPYRELRL